MVSTSMTSGLVSRKPPIETYVKIKIIRGFAHRSLKVPGAFLSKRPEMTAWIKRDTLSSKLSKSLSKVSFGA